MAKTIWIGPKGDFGNRALQFLAAEGIRRRVPCARIVNIHLPEVGILEPAVAPSRRGNIYISQVESRLDVDWLATCLRQDGVSAIILADCWAQHMDNYPDRARARVLIPPCVDTTHVTGFGERDLVCSIRAGEILRAVHPSYLPLPPAYYLMLAERTGLNLVFYGQIGDDPYSRSLRNAFPKSRFYASQGRNIDFEVLRRSANVAISVSTFSWLAAWLSNAKRVIMPVCGLFNQGQEPYTNLLPLAESTYEFILFPIAYSVDIWRDPSMFFAVQDHLAKGARWIEADELRTIALRRRAVSSVRTEKKPGGKPRLMTPRPKRIDLASKLFYAELFAFWYFAWRVGLRSAKRHYRRLNLALGHGPLLMDYRYYTWRYADAALAISEGYYTDAYHHYVDKGRALGYRRTAPAVGRE